MSVSTGKHNITTVNSLTMGLLLWPLPCILCVSACRMNILIYSRFPYRRLEVWIGRSDNFVLLRSGQIVSTLLLLLLTYTPLHPKGMGDRCSLHTGKTLGYCVALP